MSRSEPWWRTCWSAITACWSPLWRARKRRCSVATRTPVWNRRPQRSCTLWPATNALADGNQRLALAATIAFLGVNGRRLTLSNDEAYELVMDVAAGHRDGTAELAGTIRRGSRPR